MKFESLTKYTLKVAKRPVTSPWSNLVKWKYVDRKEIWQVWRTMK